MDQVFDEILVRKNTPHILLSDTKDIIAAMKKDFSEIVEIKSIGTSWENRSIDMIVIDGSKSADKTKLSQATERPGVVITGAHHSREFITIQMALY